MNRMVTAVAAYELAKKESHMNAKDARDYAVAVLDATQLDYSPENRPIILQKDWARVAFQFRQFSQQVAWQIGLALSKALQKLPSNERNEARTYLLYLMLSTFTLAGVRGMPAAGMVFVIASMMMDDGEDAEYSFEKSLREMLGDDLGGVMSNGIFSLGNIDASVNLGLGDIIPGSFSSSRDSTASKEVLKDFAFDIMGPTAAWAGKVANGLDTIVDKGDWFKGTELMLPKAGRTIMTSIRYANRGMENNNGVVRMTGSELNASDYFITAIGLKSDRIATVQKTVGVTQGIEDAIKTRARLLRLNYRMAVKYNDDGAKTRARTKISDFNTEYPQFRIKNLSKSTKAAAAAQRLADRTRGVATTKMQAEIYKDLMSDEDD